MYVRFLHVVMISNSSLNIDIRTYSVVPLGNRWGLIEWIDNLFALKAVVNEYLMADGFDGVSVS